MHYMHGGIYKRGEEKERMDQSMNQAGYVLNQEPNNNKIPNYTIGDVSCLLNLK